MVDITKILGGKQNHAIQDELWSKKSLQWYVLIRQSLFSLGPKLMDSYFAIQDSW